MSDLISREALLKQVNENKEIFESERVYLEGLILNAPAVDPFERIGSICEENCGYRPQGEWKSEGGFVFCNQCGSSHGVHKTNFCPNCGADMRKGGAM